jgi:hypothetical protein
MRCLYQKDERALPGNLQNRKDSFFLSYSPKMLCLSLLPHFFLLSLSLSLSLSVNERELGYWFFFSFHAYLWLKPGPCPLKPDDAI